MLPASIREFLATGPLGHVVTLDEDGRRRSRSRGWAPRATSW